MHRILSVSLSFLFIFLPVSSFAIRQVDYVGRLDIKKVEKIVVDSARARLYVFMAAIPYRPSLWMASHCLALAAKISQRNGH